jgi:hypothetical protein
MAWHVLYLLVAALLQVRRQLVLLGADQVGHEEDGLSQEGVLGEVLLLMTLGEVVHPHGHLQKVVVVVVVVVDNDNNNNDDDDDDVDDDDDDDDDDEYWLGIIDYYNWKLGTGSPSSKETAIIIATETTTILYYLLRYLKHIVHGDCHGPVRVRGVLNHGLLMLSVVCC